MGIASFTKFIYQNVDFSHFNFFSFVPLLGACTTGPEMQRFPSFKIIFWCTIRFRDVITADSTIDPCYAQNHTTWMTSDSAEIKASHLVMEELYRSNSSMKCRTPAQPKCLSEFN